MNESLLHEKDFCSFDDMTNSQGGRIMSQATAYEWIMSTWMSHIHMNKCVLSWTTWRMTQGGRIKRVKRLRRNESCPHEWGMCTWMSHVHMNESCPHEWVMCTWMSHVHMHKYVFAWTTWLMTQGGRILSQATEYEWFISTWMSFIFSWTWQMTQSERWLVVGHDSLWDMTRSHTWHDSSAYGTWLIHTVNGFSFFSGHDRWCKRRRNNECGRKKSQCQYDRIIFFPLWWYEWWHRAGELSVWWFE